MSNISQSLKVDVLTVERILIVITSAEDMSLLSLSSVEFEFDCLALSN